MVDKCVVGLGGMICEWGGAGKIGGFSWGVIVGEGMGMNGVSGRVV